MHRIEETPYGYRLVVEDFLGPSEADSMLSDLRAAVRPRRSPFALLLDLRVARSLHADAQEALQLALRHCREAGMERSACVLDSAIVLLQTRCLAREACLEDSLRILDVSREPEWERAALGWLERGLDPGA